jgi:hypothetical protein
MVRTAVTALCLTLWASPTEAGTPPQGAVESPSWIVAVSGGAALPFPSNRLTTRGVVSLSLARVGWRLHEVEVSLGAGFSELAKEVTTSARYGLRLSVWRLTFSLGARLGHIATHVSKELGELWTHALVVEPGAVVSVRVWRRVELRAAVPGFAFHWNDLWLTRWEPSLGVGVRL